MRSAGFDVLHSRSIDLVSPITNAHLEPSNYPHIQTALTMTTTSTTTAEPGRRRRTSYRCTRCGEPKRGHQCIFEQRLLALAANLDTVTPTAELVAAMARPAVAMADAATQAEMDEGMRVRALLLRDK